MTISKHEILTVSCGADPKSIAIAMDDVPSDARIVDVAVEDIESWMPALHRSKATITFRREVTDE